MVGSVKVRVPIDQIYLSRISSGLTAITKYAGLEYTLRITYIYPAINNGVFTVDMEFEGEAPKDIKRGLSLIMSIELGEPSKALLLPLGGFYNDTGGKWVYVLNAEGTKAEKRPIKIGRKNKQNYELLNGLAAGEKLIISSYKNFNNNEILILN
jgi:HlyD family secretion protein